jgi:hypothetical protein
LAVIDSKTLLAKTAISLKDHPEGFQIDPVRKRAYVNVPDAHEIAVVDLAKNQQIASWNELPARANFPMALLGDGDQIAVAFRRPSRLATFDTSNGAVVADVLACGDADDVFFDARRHRLYVSCGEGKIAVYDVASHALNLVAEVPTASGARTAFFDPADDRYFVAVREGFARLAEIWVYRPTAF